MTQERDRIGEIQDRLRRIETRLTKYMQERGFDTQVQEAAWGPGYVIIPSVDIRLRDLLKAIPASYGWEDDLEVVHAGEVVAVLTAYVPED